MDNRHAFTLIELLVVIAIVGILAGIIIVSINGATEKANIAKYQTFSSSINHTLMNNAVTSFNFNNIPDNRIGTTLLVADIKDVWGSNTGYAVGRTPQIRGGSDCVVGKCIEFSGGDSDTTWPCNGDYISTNTTGYPDADNPITLEAWVKLKTGNVTNPIIFIGKYWFDSTGLGMLNNKFAFGFYDSTPAVRWYYYTAKNITIGNWTHVVATYKNQEVKICVNGDCQKYTSTYIPRSGPSNYKVVIGAESTQYYHLKGFIDDVRIYSEAMTVGQVKANYFAGLKSLLAVNGITKNEYSKRISEMNNYCFAKITNKY
jgi:prepilin-type N-terminal cleavage/methylation domain-containing protein